MNLKSVIQIVLLIVLLLAGGVVYLSQQEGGLDFVKELVGFEVTPPPRPVPVRAARPPAPAAPAPTPVAKPEVPLIPPESVKGEVQKAPFAPDVAEIENGVLTLRQGKEPWTTEVKVFLQTKPWHVPSGRSFQILDQAAAPDTPLIRIRWQENGQKAPRQRDFTAKYTLRLEFGTEQDRKLPGKIYVVLPDEDKSRFAGTFTADVRGFRFVDGKPDLGSDSIDTLQYLALHEVLKDDPDKVLADLLFRQGRYTATPSAGPPTGYLEMEYRVGDSTPIAQKFQFVKEQQQWRVTRTLRPDQLDEAHPYNVPDAKDPPVRVFPYLAAKRVEKDAQKRQPGKLLNLVEVASRHSDKRKIGVAEVSYRIGDGQTMQTAFLYKLTPAGWTLARELGKKERVNLATGKIETHR